MLSIRRVRNIPPVITALYLDAFPPEERRELPLQEALVASGRLQLLLLEEAADFAGFVFCWELPDFVFIEHFAIHPARRGLGLGSQVIQILEAQFGRPIVLETEPPDTPDAIRRIRFYETLGFSAYPHHYIQPAYHSAVTPLRMLLMQKGMPPEEHTFLKISIEIFREVYGKDDTDQASLSSR